MFGCKKDRDPLSWNVAVLAPLIYGDLTINNLLKDTIISTNSDESIQLKFSSNLYSLNFDSLVKIPDTIIKNDYTIPYIAGLTVNPGQIFVSEPEDVYLNLNDVELTKLIVSGGNIFYSLKSNIPAEIVYEYQIINALDNQGQPFSKTIVVPASTSINSVKTGSFDLSGYSINLTGTNGNVYNTLSTLIQIKLSDNNSSDVLINNEDSVYIENKISNLSIEYAEGYFGNQVTSVVNNKSAIAQMSNIVDGSIDLEQVSVDFNIVNGIGADAAFTVQNLTSVKGNSQIPLSHALIGSQNHINRAYKTGVDINSTKFSSSFTSTNSNVENWIENLPDSVLYSLNLELNPLGNVSAHHDFISSEAPFEVNMNVDMPLSFLADNLTLIDTITIDSDNLEQVVKGKLKINIENGFPLGAKLSLKNIALTEELFSSSPIISGLIDNQGVVIESSHSDLEISFSEEAIDELKVNNQLIIQVKFDSPPSSNLLVIYDYYNLRFNVVTDFIYQNNIK
jgi:hypothetical protein